MIPLKSRLDALRRSSGVAGARPDPMPPPLRERLDRLHARSRHGQDRCDAEGLAKALGGELLDTGVVVLDQHLPLPEADPNPASAHWPLGQPVVPAELCFIDTETNGLAGGTGTIAFLIGAAWVGSRRLHVRQYLLTHYAGEAEMLRRFASSLDAGSVVVTYNGKRFDGPLLATRWRLHAQADALADRPHADLLYPVRRLFSSRWPDCRLATTEKRLLDMHRDGDLPGSEAPMAWMAWLRRGDPTPLAGVVEHNRQDLLALARLWFRLQAVYAQPQAFDLDLAACARTYQEFAQPERAYRLLRDSRDRLDADGLRLLAGLHRRHGEWKAAVEIWQLLARGGCQTSLAALAKFHEHRAADPETALSFARRLQDPSDRDKRMQRLQAKLAVAAGGD